MMYRIMIVDDEPLILAGIGSMLDWEEYGCRIVGKATNGQQALDKMEDLQPDIVITDIKMPAMDGISFMKAAKEKGSQAMFILLTNLEEFSMARDALRLGAVDYLVKLELSEEKLAETLKLAMEKCDLHRQAAASQEDSRFFAFTKAESIRNYFRRLLFFDSEAKAEGELMELVQSQFSCPVVVLIHFNYGFEDFSSAFTRADQKKVMGFAEDIITEMVKGFFEHSCLIRREQNGFILVLSAAGIPDHQHQIRTMSEKFLRVLKDYFEVSAAIAVSLAGSGIGDLPDLYYQAMSASNHTYYEWSDPIVFYSEACEESSRHSSNFNISFLKKDLLQAIRQNDGERFAQIMDQLIALLEECKPSRLQAVNACCNLYYFITSFFEEHEEPSFPYVVDIMGQLNRMGNLNHIIQWICWFRDQVKETLEKRQEVKVDKHVELAQKYIREHCREKITLGQVAEALNISQGHLSSTFKKTVGQTFTDYVNQVKVEQAKELIETHQYMMYEISDMLGFDTQYYFSTVFKKMTGFSPREYESMVVKEKNYKNREKI